MRKTLALIVLALLSAAPASAHMRVRLLESHAALPAPPTHAVRLITPIGDPAGEPWQGWINVSRVSTGAYTLILNPALDCRGALGCSIGEPEQGPMQAATRVLMTDGRFFARDTLYFELGHQFDWHFLTDADRRYLARKWGVPHAHWWNSPLASVEVSEDGLEANFAEIYKDCAWGQNDNGAAIAPMTSPGALRPPAIYPKIDTCAFIDRLARVREPLAN